MGPYFGRQSGATIDVCRDHGAWFNAEDGNALAGLLLDAVASRLGR